jgi:phospholipase C
MYRLPKDAFMTRTRPLRMYPRISPAEHFAAGSFSTLLPVFSTIARRAAISAMLLIALPCALAQQQVGHIIVIFQENRSPDNLFHGLPNADIANAGINSKGQKITLTPLPLANTFDPNHAHTDFESMYDGGKMDGADKIQVICLWNKKHCPGPHPTFTYVKPSDVAPYFQMAEQYVFADRMFQTQQGPSFPAHQFILSGTSAPETGSTSFAAENPQGYVHHFLDTGCKSPKKEYVLLVDKNGQEGTPTYPCFEHQTLVDLLDQQKVSWRYYTPSLNFEWDAPNAIKHLRFGPDWANVIVPPTQILNDISAGQLPSVTWVIPAGQNSDHPGQKSSAGPSWVASIVNAVGGSQYWNDTVIFIAWDDWGGFYDHVVPNVVPVGSSNWGAGYAYGFRVPLIIVSPFAKQAYVSHVTHDFGSILKFIEEVFNLPSLGYADAYADDLSDCFQFDAKPRPFRKIHAPYDAKYFLDYKGKLLDPDDD